MRVYIASSLKNHVLNARIDEFLSNEGVKSFLPQRDAEGDGMQPWTGGDGDVAGRIFAANLAGIDSADVVLVVECNIGTDTAWECGYAIGRGKVVILLESMSTSLKMMYMVSGAVPPNRRTTLYVESPESFNRSMRTTLGLLITNGDETHVKQ